MSRVEAKSTRNPTLRKPAGVGDSGGAEVPEAPQDMARHQSTPTVRDYGRRFNGGIIGSWPLVAVALFGLCLQPAPSASVLDSGWGSVLGSGLAGSLSYLISNLRGGRYTSSNVSVGGGIPGGLASASAGILSLRRTPGPVSPQPACETTLADERQEGTKQVEDWIEYPNDEQCAILMQGLDIAREGSGLETYVSEVRHPASRTPLDAQLPVRVSTHGRPRCGCAAKALRPPRIARESRASTAGVRPRERRGRGGGARRRVRPRKRHRGCRRYRTRDGQRDRRGCRR